MLPARHYVRTLVSGWPAVLLLMVSGCESANQGRVLAINATGHIDGQAYLDADRSRRFDTGDAPLIGLRVHLVPWGTIDTARSSTSNGSGVLRFAGLLVGRYKVLVDSASGGDSVVVVRVDTSTMNLGPNDTLSLSVGLSYPLLTLAAARTWPTGRKVFVEAVALTGANGFADTTAHIRAQTGALRLVRVLSGTFAPGDSVRVRGTVGVRDGQPVLRDVTLFPIGIGTLPAVDSLSTAVVAGAGGGLLDAALVRGGGILQDSANDGRNLILRVNDGTGMLRILLDEDISFQLGAYAVAGARVRASGVLVPAGAGEWYLKPRTSTDVRVDIDVLTPVQVRQRPVGQRVFVDGIALNRPNLFGDSTLHLTDDAGNAIRIIEALNPNIFAGDRIRVAGTVATRTGQVVVKAPTIFTLSTGGLISFRGILTAEAANAGLGVLDAASVRIQDATIMSTTPGAGGDLRAVVDDGSGPVTVALEGDLGFNTTGWVVDSTASVRGLLVPEGGVWVLKPRVTGDVEKP